jgi:hypothetical protein
MSRDSTIPVKKAEIDFEYVRLSLGPHDLNIFLQADIGLSDQHIEVHILNNPQCIQGGGDVTDPAPLHQRSLLDSMNSDYGKNFWCQLGDRLAINPLI